MSANRFSVNSYTFHELLGVFRRPSYSPNDQAIVETVERGNPRIDLLELPRMLAERGIGHVDLCFFHLPSTDDAYLDRLRAAMDDAGVRLFCLLLDFGNLTLPPGPQREAEFAFACRWIEVARKLGATCIRAQGGSRAAGDQAPDQELFERVVEAYRRLADVAEGAGLRLLTENFGSFLLDVDRLLSLLERLEGRLGLVADFGNGRRPGEYDGLARLVRHAESIHAKPDLDSEGRILEDDYRTCVRLAEEAGFSGPYTLVYRGPLPAFAGLEQTRDLVAKELGLAG